MVILPRILKIKKMKKITIALLFICTTIVTFSSCESKSEGLNEKVQFDSILSELMSEHELIVEQLNFKVYQAEKERDYLQSFISYLEKNPDFHLLLIDYELSAIEKGIETYGSFSDYFVLKIHAALEAGVPRSEIQKRINKLVQLANRGNFGSDYEEKIFREGGAKALLQEIGLD